MSCASTIASGVRAVAALLCAAAAIGCTETRDLGSTVPHGLLPVDERNPIVLLNDSATDNWQGEYAIAFSSNGGPKLAAIIIDSSGPWPDIDTNVAGWRAMVQAAADAGITGIPDPTTSIGAPLTRPADGQIASTAPNRSEGARAILDTSAQLSLPYRPLVVVTGGRLTDVADAYLMDPTVADRVVVVSSLGSTTASGGAMGAPNGEMDPWADTIVTACFRFVQVSAYYDQLTDVPAAKVANLPSNPFGAWIAAKQPNIWNLAQAADQVAVMAVGVPGFATAVQRVAPAGPVAAGASAGPELTTNPNGPLWLVTQSAPAPAIQRFWQILGAMP